MAQRPLRWAIGWFGLFCLTYFLVVLTAVGQGLDDRAHYFRWGLHKNVIVAADKVLHLIDPLTLLVFIGILAGLGWVRFGRWGLTIAAAFTGTVILPELLKWLLPRPDHGVDIVWAPQIAFDTYPSGHATIATSAAIAVIVLASPRWRLLVATIATLWASGVCLWVLALGWHRPSDVVGGVSLAALTWCLLLAVPRVRMELTLLRDAEQAGSGGTTINRRGQVWLPVCAPVLWLFPFWLAYAQAHRNPPVQPSWGIVALLIALCVSSLCWWCVLTQILPTRSNSAQSP